MISHRDKCIFVHTPKCAGESIEMVLSGQPMNVSEYRGHPEKHWGVREISVTYPGEYDSYFKFSVVRNPWERVISWSMYRDRRFGRTVGTFEERLWLDLNDVHFVSYMQKKSYRNMLFLDGKLAMDYVIRMEQLQEGIDAVLDILGRPQVTLPHANRTDHIHYANYYKSESRERVRKLFVDDIELFGYKF
jgi:predicted RNA-binding protein